ncbi:hypothetical protein C0Q70_05486 [Pomacea canaliculata]|uniref:Major facilitator superfamily (MFS) profile domain-containing protein n=1 Tax=Pomacea canaliculata TaxID=400727 RepID=A0A2T7PLD4_POMCA|nr:hypothetical protein C0Q70_05486 [Pomacea canaliculata]
MSKILSAKQILQQREHRVNEAGHGWWFWEKLACSYFQRRRSLALALAKCGASAGAVSMPPLFTFLTEQYGLRGALLLMGGICLHTIPATLLLRPTSSFSKMSGRPKQSSSDHGVKMSETERTGDASTAPEGMTSRAVDAAQVEMILTDGDVGKSAAKTITRDTAGNTQLSQKRYFPGISTSRSQCIFGNEGKRWKSGLQSYSALTTSQTLRQRSDEASKRWHPIKSSRSKALEYPCFAKGARHLPQESSKQRLTQSSHPKIGSDFLERFSSSLVVKTLSSSAVNLGSASLMSQYKIESRGLTSMAKQETDAQEAEKLRAGQLKSAQPEEAQNATSERFEQSRPADTSPASPRSTVDFSLLWQPQFRLLLVYFMLSPFANLAVDYLPAAAAEKGVSEARASLLLSIIGSLDLFSRLASGVVANLRIVNIRTMIIGCFFVIGLVNQFVRFLESFPTFVVVAVVMGLVGGVPTSLSTVLVIEVVGIEHLGHAISFVHVFYGVSMAAFYPLLGYFRDKTGSYDLTYHVVGCGVLGAAGLLCFGGRSSHSDKSDKFVTHSSDGPSGAKNK